MCELFAMNGRVPSDVELSLTEFSRHGGLTDHHRDGWGVAWYEDGDLHIVKEAAPAASSACVRFLQSAPFVSRTVLSHIRHATQGAVRARNCQPFARELGGAWHCFAHNGDLKNIAAVEASERATFLPVGETDSERAFCALLERLRGLWRDGRPPLEARRAAVADFARTLRTLGPANFLYSDGDALFAHAHKRHQRDGTVRAPGLWRLARHCPAGGRFETDGLRIEATQEQHVVLVASVPLTGERWEPLGEGELIVARDGVLVPDASTSHEHPAP